MDDLLGRHSISLFLILLFTIRLSSQRAARDKELRYFWMTVVSCFLLVLQDILPVMIIGVFANTISAAGEEIGWRGYLFPAVHERKGTRPADNCRG